MTIKLGAANIRHLINVKKLGQKLSYRVMPEVLVLNAQDVM